MKSAAKTKKQKQAAPSIAPATYWVHFNDRVRQSASHDAETFEITKEFVVFKGGGRLVAAYAVAIVKEIIIGDKA